MRSVVHALPPVAEVVDQSVLANAARAAIDAVGGGAKMARVCGVTRFAVQQWKEKGIPPQRVGRVAKVTGLSFSALRPDLFPAEDEGA